MDGAVGTTIESTYLGNGRKEQLTGREAYGYGSGSPVEIR
jgi:hypothetical protein